MNDIHNIKPLMDVGFPWVSVISMVLLTLGLLVLFWWLILKALKKKKTEPPPVPQAAKVSPKKTALQALTNLEKMGWIERGKAAAFYLELDLIFKGFLQDNSEAPVSSYTRAELKGFLSTLNLQSEDIMARLNRSEIAKFAGSQVSKTEMKTDFDWVKDFVSHFKEEEAVHMQTIANKNRP